VSAAASDQRPQIGRAPEPAVDPTAFAREFKASPDRSGATAIRFRELTTASTGIDFIHRSGNSPEKHFPTTNGSGVAMLDYNRDGRLDLYFATTRDFPLDGPTKSRGNKLYLNRGDGTFEDTTEQARVGFNGFNHGLAVGDVDGNGFPDLFLANFGPNVLYLNQGDGTFRDASAGLGTQGGLWSSGAAMFDYDGDADLDLYVSCYGQWTEKGDHPYCGDTGRGIRTFCSPLSIPPERHFLYRNRGDGTFEDVTEAAGILRRDGRGMGVVAADVNRDGWIDLYVANDLSPHFLFLNRGDGTFEDLTESSGAAVSGAGDYQAGMGVDAEDLTGDGLPELFATHFREDYNTLYLNLDGRTYQDISARAGIVKDSLPDVGWGCALADFDNDGHLDMMVVNGHIDDNLTALTGTEIPQAEPAKLWRNQGDGRFRLVRDAGAFFDTGHVARGAAFGDLDDDGDIDVVVSLMDDHPAILINESAPHPWIRLELVAGRSGRPAIGAVAEVHAEGRVIHRQLKGGGSYLSAGDPRLLIGLGSAERVERVVIHWPGGTRSELAAPATYQSHRIEGPESWRMDIDCNGGLR
jgi:hypothetical protein